MRRARLTGSNAHRVDYGAECVRNVLPERAEVEFNSILAVDPRNVNALNGLSAIALELVHAGKAEELFRRSRVIRQTDEAARGLAEAERMRNP